MDILRKLQRAMLQELEEYKKHKSNEQLVLCSEAFVKEYIEYLREV